MKCKLVINAAGPWVDDVLASAGKVPRPRMFRASKAFNLLTRRLPFEHAVGLQVPRASRDADAKIQSGSSTYFVIPWCGYSLIGTKHLRCEPAAQPGPVPWPEVRSFLADVNSLLGVHELAESDVVGVFAGHLPEKDDVSGIEVVLQKRARVTDHDRDNIRGLITIVGVKWTTACAVAEQAVKLAAGKLGGPRNIRRERRLTADGRTAQGNLAEAVRGQWVVHLDDYVMRRKQLYLQQGLDRAELARIARRVGQELDWSADRIHSETESAIEHLNAFYGRPKL